MTIYDDVFGKSFPFAIGFDRTFQLLNRADHLHDTSNYPPYNIVKIDAENFSVEVAVAGFGKKDISITKEKEVLLIEGSKENLNENTEYVHRGLSGRTFNRKFTLADDIVVKGADMKDGILSVSLERIIPEEDKPVEIKIK
jgi:molecular chaperone IbpA|tara:strand:- start:1057 stop:1479 length:423 start_codon:yes stop_codon:yes gene_type:complete